METSKEEEPLKYVSPLLQKYSSLDVSQMYLPLVLVLQIPFLLVVQLHLEFLDPPEAGVHTQR